MIVPRLVFRISSLILPVLIAHRGAPVRRESPARSPCFRVVREDDLARSSTIDKSGGAFQLRQTKFGQSILTLLPAGVFDRAACALRQQVRIVWDDYHR